MNKLLIKHHALEMNLHVTRIFIFDKKKKNRRLLILNLFNKMYHSRSDISNITCCKTVTLHAVK